MGDDRKGQTYKIQGFAYNGYGTAINRVELTLDGGKTWKYCFKKYLPKPLRYVEHFYRPSMYQLGIGRWGEKHWAWLFWYRSHH